MITLQSLAENIAAYVRGAMTLGKFQAWYEGNCIGAIYTVQGPLQGVCADIDAALSAYSLNDIDEDELKEELASSISPFSSRGGIRAR